MAQSHTIDRPRTLARTAPAQRYVPVLQALHWLTAALMFSVIPLGWVMMSLPEGAPLRSMLFGLHKSIGVTILACAIVRVVLRSRHPAPSLDDRLASLEAAAAGASHVLLYVVLIAMPASGYLMSADGVHSFSYFGLFTVPHLPKDDWVEALGERLHLLGQWAAYGLIGLHLAATAWHVAFRRDGTLDRMLPPQEP